MSLRPRGLALFPKPAVWRRELLGIGIEGGFAGREPLRLKSTQALAVAVP